jgi:ABC-type polysaccharide/polyol phosphate transport system ATPase subunit
MLMGVTEALPAVVVDGVSKSFRLPHERVHTLKERALHPLRRSGDDVLRALRDVAFVVERGEFFGIVGRNGSGKSTLLKCLAGIYATDRGDIYVNGRMSTFIELGVGFNPDLPARDNVMINATMLGLSPREARRRFDAIIDFAELRDFTDLKLKNYSSGMMVRLAFSVMIQVDAEILLIDEVLAVGDASFQQKCFEEFERIKRSNSTVLFVTHDMGSVQRFCDRALLLEHGKVVELGDPEHVGNRYLELNFSEQARAAEAETADAPEGAAAEPEAVELEAEEEPVRYGDGRAEIVEAWFEDADGRRTDVLAHGKHATFAARVRFNEDLEDPLIGLNLVNSHRDHCLSASNLKGPKLGACRAGRELTFRIGFDCIFTPDRYFATPAIAAGPGAWIDRRERFVDVMVTGIERSDSIVTIPYEVTIDQAEVSAS